ncbi:hypothetical protein CVU37_05945 [candidate division BRC1 bacterium HGW-BRC1-1]|nr:MAG: hypothetical protein CVU37_05945 [candidate division BRC1 bacterium HGW-BRC1-1]
MRTGTHERSRKPKAKSEAECTGAKDLQEVVGDLADRCFLESAHERAHIHGCAAAAQSVFDSNDYRLVVRWDVEL